MAEPERRKSSSPRMGRADLLPAIVIAVGGIGATYFISRLSGQIPDLDSMQRSELEAFAGMRLWAYDAVILFQATTLLLRRQLPTTTLAIVGALDCLMSTMSAVSGIGNVAVMVAVYTVAVQFPLQKALTTLGAVATVWTVFDLLITFSVAPSMALWIAGSLTRSVVTFAVAAFIGRYVQTRRRYLQALHDQIHSNERELKTASKLAVQEERARMARELHDVAAHHLSGIVVMAGAVGSLIDSDTKKAHEYVESIRIQGSATLENLRVAVGILRDDEERELSPAPALSDVQELVDAIDSRGVRVKYEMRGSAVDLGPLAELTAYRTIQEALSNAQFHAPGSVCHVIVEYFKTNLVLTVENTVPPAGPLSAERNGFGLIGMRERAGLIGATLESGPIPSGGWLVKLTIPKSKHKEMPTATSPGDRS